MGRKLTWVDVYNSFSESDKDYYARENEKMCHEARFGSVDKSKEIAEELGKWEDQRWKIAKRNIAASQTAMWS